MTSSSADIEQLIHDLQPEEVPFSGDRVLAIMKLGSFDFSSFEIVQALLLVMESDPDRVVQERAHEALQTEVHQELLKQHPDMQTRFLEAQRVMAAAVEERYGSIRIGHPPKRNFLQKLLQRPFNFKMVLAIIVSFIAFSCANAGMIMLFGNNDAMGLYCNGPLTIVFSMIAWALWRDIAR